MTTPRVALVHDWLTGMRGGEKVLEVLCRMYPSADLLTLVHVPDGALADHRTAPAQDVVSSAAAGHPPRLSLLPAALSVCHRAVRP